jgi:hypothetical protein
VIEVFHYPNRQIIKEEDRTVEELWKEKGRQGDEEVRG